MYAFKNIIAQLFVPPQKEKIHERCRAICPNKDDPDSVSSITHNHGNNTQVTSSHKQAPLSVPISLCAHLSLCPSLTSLSFSLILALPLSLALAENLTLSLVHPLTVKDESRHVVIV